MTLVNTRMQNLRAEYQGRLDEKQFRASRYGAWDLARRQTQSPTSILSPQARDIIKRSFLNTGVQIPVLQKPDITIANTRSCTVAAGENTSALVTLTFVTYAFGFTMVPAQYGDNEISYQQDFDRKLRARLLALAAALDTAAITALNTNRNQFWTGIDSLFAGDEATTDIVTVASGEADDMYNQFTAMMELMDYYGTYDVVANSAHSARVRRLSNQGVGNDTNDAFQLIGYNHGFSNRITNALTFKETGFLVAPDSIAVENRNDADSLMGHTVGGGSKRWEIVPNVPIVGLDMGAYYTEDCSDQNALHAGTGPLTRTKVEGYEWSTDVCYVTAYNPDLTADYNPIVKFHLS